MEKYSGQIQSWEEGSTKTILEEWSPVPDQAMPEADPFKASENSHVQ